LSDDNPSGFNLKSLGLNGFGEAEDFGAYGFPLFYF
jgi:hypothetical protein